MQLRTEIKFWAASIAALFLIILLERNALLAQESHLGMWVARNQMTDTKHIDRFVEFASANGFTDLFVQVRGRGDAYYRSEIVSFSDKISDKEFDPLGYLLQVGHSNGLKIHAWMNIYLLWSSGEKPKDPRHLLIEHPEWCTTDADGVRDINRSIDSFRRNGTEGVYLSPLVPEVRIYLTNVISELILNYDVDGIHLDYVRYPKNTYDFNETARFQFKQKHGVDPILLSISSKSFNNVWNEQVLNELVQDWDDFRRDAITELIKNIHEAMRSSDKKIQLSAAVKPDPEEAKYHFYQDWECWIKNGWLDFVVPLNYTENTESFESCVKKIGAIVPNDKVWMGIGIYNQNKYDAMAKTMIGISNGFRNVVFFSYDTFADDPSYLSTIKKALSVEQ